MRQRKIIRTAVFLTVCLFLAGLLGGCSASFAGFALGSKEELQFVCDEPSEGLREESSRADSLKEEEAFSGEESFEERSSEESPGEVTESPHGEEAAAVSDGKVDLNTAGLEELMTLNGIGETRARAIIDYRTSQGAFTSIEDIMQIPGIKEGIFSKIRDQIVVR